MTRVIPRENICSSKIGSRLVAILSSNGGASPFTTSTRMSVDIITVAIYPRSLRNRPGQKLGSLQGGADGRRWDLRLGKGGELGETAGTCGTPTAHWWNYGPSKGCLTRTRIRAELRVTRGTGIRTFGISDSGHVMTSQANEAETEPARRRQPSWPGRSLRGRLRGSGRPSRRTCGLDLSDAIRDASTRGEDDENLVRGEKKKKEGGGGFRRGMGAPAFGTGRRPQRGNRREGSRGT